MIADISTDEMFDVIDDAVNGTDFQQGKVDAVAHVARIIEGATDSAALSDIQDEIIAGKNGVTEGYVNGYTAMWTELKHMLF